jgi:hypothetical protein
VAEGGRYCTDLFLEAGGDRKWIFRRDGRVRRPMGRMVARTRDGVPYLRPEGVLLYKAAGLRSKDASDFEAVAPDLDAESVRWLVDALSIAYPGHPWIARLQSVAIR